MKVLSIIGDHSQQILNQRFIQGSFTGGSFSPANKDATSANKHTYLYDFL